MDSSDERQAICATYAITPSGTNIEKYRENQYLWYFWY